MVANADVQRARGTAFRSDAANALLDELLDRVVEALQLTPTQHQSAEEKYNAVAEWLGADGSLVATMRPKIYPQGSLRTQTTVRPLQHQEFDLDLVCELAAAPDCGPGALYELLWARMQENERYRRMLEPCARCIRLKYANDFHLDIVPAIPDPAGTTATSLLIPDQEQQAWRPSNPKGYADWLEEKARLPVRMDKRAMGATIEPLRAPQPLSSKPPLKLAIQLFKRWRDVAFSRRTEEAPSSIVLATMAGLVYAKEERVTDALGAIISKVAAWACSEPIHLLNPASPKECITERWHMKPGAYSAFIEEIVAFERRWQVLRQEGTLLEVGKELELLFGDVPVKRAMKAHADSHTQAREMGQLYASRATGTLLTGAGSNALRVPSHTFHGGSDEP
jgi:hypothetical protein